MAALVFRDCILAHRRDDVAIRTKLLVLFVKIQIDRSVV